MTTPTTTQPECCQYELFFGPDGDRTRQHCWRHATPEDRARIQEYDRRGAAIGLKRAPLRDPDSLAWPYGPNINVTTRGRMLDWAEAHGLRKAHPNHPCLAWLRKGRCMTGLCEAMGTGSDWQDHPSAWNRNGQPAVLVAQPYGLTDDDRADLARLDAESGIRVVEIRDASWYGYGTTFVGVWRADVYAAATAEDTP